jgi:hypothetical protein
MNIFHRQCFLNSLRPRQAVQPGEIAPLSGVSQIDSADLLRADVEVIGGQGPRVLTPSFRSKRHEVYI